MGVSIFRDTAPNSFNTFDRALSTMFRLTAGETWIDGLAAYSAEDGSLYYGSALFIYSYIVIVVWILLQVSVAVLLVRARPRTRGRAARGPRRFDSQRAVGGGSWWQNLPAQPQTQGQRRSHRIAAAPHPSDCRQAFRVIASPPPLPLLPLLLRGQPSSR